MADDRTQSSEPIPPGDKSSGTEPAGPTADAPQKKNPWCLPLLVLVLLAPFATILVNSNGQVLGNSDGDAPKAYYHYGYFLGQCWRAGIMPLWNPHIMLGIPFLGEGQASVFHPISFLHAVLNPGVAINWLVAISFVLTGVFFFGYLRALGLGRPASWCGAMTWSFSSAMISRIYAGHLNILLTFISIPMILMFWEHYRTGGGVRQLVGVAVGYGLMILAFYPQVLYIFSLFFLLSVLIQSSSAMLDRSSTATREGKAILRLGIFIVLGIGVGAIQLLPGLDFVTQSFRQEATIAFCGSYSFPPENLLTLIAPNFFGGTLGPMSNLYWGRNLFWEMWVYVGVLPLLLAVAGAWTAPRGRRWALAGCVAIFLILGLGKHTFLFPMIYEHVPFFNIFRGSSKNTLAVLFCLVTLSAYGFEALFGEGDEVKRQRLRRVAAAAGTVMFLCCLVGAVFLLRHAETPGSNWEHFVKRVWASGEQNVPPFTTTWQETARGATESLTRGLIFLLLGTALVFVKPPTRGRKYFFLLPIALILIDLLGIFSPLRQTFPESMSQSPLVLDESARTPYPPRILVPANPMPNLAMRSGYSSAFGLTGNTLKRYNDFISHLQNLDPRETRLESRFEQLTPPFTLLGFDAQAFKPEDFPPQAKRIGTLGDKLLTPFYESDVGPRQAFLAAAPKYFSRHEDALSYVLAHHTEAWASPAIERSEPQLTAQPLQEDEFVGFTAFAPNRVELEVRSNWPRELVLRGMFEKNWRAEVNGSPAKIEPANHVFRAVQVPEGTSRVIFHYRPKAFYWGAAVTGLSLAILLLIFVGASRSSSTSYRHVMKPKTKLGRAIN